MEQFEGSKIRECDGSGFEGSQFEVREDER